MGDGLADALRSLVGVRCQRSLATNSLMLRFDFREQKKGRAYIWIDPPWRFMADGRFITGSADWPVWDGVEEPEVNRRLWESWCSLFDALNGELELLSSEALVFEIERTPDPERRAASADILKLASRTLRLLDEIDSEAATLIQSGFKPFDALHLAFSSWARVEYFCTCDDKLRKKAQRLKSLKTTVVTPLELVMKVVP